MTTFSTSSILLVFIILGLGGSALAQTQFLDPSFGSGGIVTTDFGPGHDTPKAVIVQPDGKILLGGYAHWFTSNVGGGLVRYDEDGTLDSGFGEDGIVNMPLYGPNGWHAFALRADGSILAGGSDNDGYHIWHLHPDGSVDSTFGTSGRIPTNTSAIAGIGASADGGFLMRDNTRLFRFLPNGEPDLSFGNDGETLLGVSLSGNTDHGSIHELENGRILVAGRRTIDGISYPAIQACLADGSVDTSFGTDGIAIGAPPGSSPFCVRMAIQPDGRLVMTYGRSSSATSFHVQRFMPDGSVDSSFGENGSVDLPLGTPPTWALDVAVSQNGLITVVGDVTQNGSWAGVLRLLPDGMPDAFGNEGLILLPRFAQAGIRMFTAVQADGKTLLADIMDGAFGLARFSNPMSVGIPFTGTHSLNAFVISDPTGDLVTLHLILDTPETMDITLMDASGRIISAQARTSLPKGSHQRMIPTNGLASGVYLLVLTSGHTRTSIRFVKS